MAIRHPFGKGGRIGRCGRCRGIRRRRGHLRHFKFVGLREDEKATDVVRE
jgi:hypothetical protein